MVLIGGHYVHDMAALRSVSMLCALRRVKLPVQGSSTWHIPCLPHAPHRHRRFPCKASNAGAGMAVQAVVSKWPWQLASIMFSSIAAQRAVLSLLGTLTRQANATVDARPAQLVRLLITCTNQPQPGASWPGLQPSSLSCSHADSPGSQHFNQPSRMPMPLAALGCLRPPTNQQSWLRQQEQQACCRWLASTGLQLQQHRGVFGAPREHINLEVHTHAKYRKGSVQPVYNWMTGRFVMDRNGVVWHKQANRGSKRTARSSNTLFRLARWKPLSAAYAAKFRKLPGVKERIRYWSAPDPRAVPGFDHDTPYRPAPRMSAKPDKRAFVGDPALRPH